MERKLVKLIQAHRAAGRPIATENLYHRILRGTGAALSAELGYIVRRVCQAPIFGYRCRPPSAPPPIHSPTTASLPAANAIATLSELATLMDPPAKSGPQPSNGLCNHFALSLRLGHADRRRTVPRSVRGGTEPVQLGRDWLARLPVPHRGRPIRLTSRGCVRSSAGCGPPVQPPSSLAPHCRVNRLRSGASTGSAGDRGISLGTRDTGGPQASQSSSSATGRIP